MADLSQVTDEQLVELVRTKNQELYTHVVVRYESKLMRYAISIVKDPHLAEDIVQNAFIKAFINLQGFNTKKKFSSWIYRITHNEAINEIKRNKRMVALDAVPDALLAEDETLSQTVDAQITKDKVQRYLEKLPMKYREPLMLFYIEEKTYDEISDILHIPPGTVATRISRAKKLLTKIAT